MSTLDEDFTAQPLTLADDQGLLLGGTSGKVLTLAPDASGSALAASPGSTSGPGGQVAVNVPIALGGDQSWSITGATFGSNRSAGLILNGNLTGTGDTLTVAMAKAGNLILDGTTSVGSLIIGGADGSQQPVDNGSVSFEGQVNNAGGGGPITIDNVLVNLLQGATGPLVLHDDNLVLQSSQHSTTNGSLTLDASDTTAAVLSANLNDIAATASGNITVGGSLILNPPSSAYPSTLCPTITPGTTQTLIKSTGGTLSGEFADVTGQPIPDGGVIVGTTYCNPTVGAAPSPQQIAMRVSYTGSAVTITYLVSTTTSLAVSAKTITTNQSETLTASVSQTSGTPTGTVAFSAGAARGATPLAGLLLGSGRGRWNRDLSHQRTGRRSGALFPGRCLHPVGGERRRLEQPAGHDGAGQPRTDHDGAVGRSSILERGNHGDLHGERLSRRRRPRRPGRAGRVHRERDSGRVPAVGQGPEHALRHRRGQLHAQQQRGRIAHDHRHLSRRR